MREVFPDFCMSMSRRPEMIHEVDIMILWDIKILGVEKLWTTFSFWII